MRLIAAAWIVALGFVASLVSPPAAQAYPWCYYSYTGCYLGPGWYDGYYWGGGYWWGRSMTDRVMDSINGCPVPYETGACGPLL